MKGLTVTTDILAEVVRSINNLVKKDVLVGIPDTTTSRDDGEPLNNATLGYIHENGSPAKNIPARPFLVPGVEDAQERIEQRLNKAVKAALGNQRRKSDDELEAAGMIARDSVKRKINSGDFAPLTEATLRARAAKGRKGAKAELASRAAGNAPDNSNARPLIDRGQLRNSINYVVRNK
jgi:hypothetical protein